MNPRTQPEEPPEWWLQECRLLAGAHIELAREAVNPSRASWQQAWWWEASRSGIPQSALRAAFAALRIASQTPRNVGELLAVARRQAEAAQDPIWRQASQIDPTAKLEGQAMAAALAGRRNLEHGNLLRAAECLTAAQHAAAQLPAPANDLVVDAIAYLAEALAGSAS